MNYRTHSTASNIQQSADSFQQSYKIHIIILRIQDPRQATNFISNMPLTSPTIHFTQRTILLLFEAIIIYYFLSQFVPVYTSICRL